MNRIAVSFVGACLTVLIAVPAMATGPIGAPEPNAAAGKFAVGAGYYRASAKVDPDGSTNWSSSKASMNEFFTEGSYGITDSAEGYIRLGASDITVDDGWDTGMDFEGDFAPFGTLGARGVFFKQDIFSLGAFVEGTYQGEWKEEKQIAGVTGTMKLKDNWNVVGGLAAQAKFNTVTVFGGPIAYTSKGKATIVVTGPGGFASDAAKYKEKGNFGGFLGVKVALPKGFSITGEGQFRSEASFGLMANKSF